MGRLLIHQDKINPETGKVLSELCPFGAISYTDGKIDISSACKMCKMCVRKGPAGCITFEEDAVPAVDKSKWRGITVFVDHDGDSVHRVTYELIGKAKELAAKIGHPVYALLIGSSCRAAAEKVLSYGVDTIYVYDDPSLSDYLPEPYTAAFNDFIEKVKPSSVLVGATNLGRQLAPRIAARRRAGLTADCTVLEMKENTDLVQIRPAFGGNIMAQIISTNVRPQFCTVRYKVFAEPKPIENPNGKIVAMKLEEDKLTSLVKILSSSRKPRETDISECDVLVAVGRGAQSEALRKMAGVLAEELGGMLACSRPLVEANIMDPKRQIGLSGRTVKPKFLITLGISGAVQFAAGMKGADCIVSVNRDPAAPIFDVAHYGIVGDVADILPKLLAKIRAEKEARK